MNRRNKRNNTARSGTNRKANTAIIQASLVQKEKDKINPKFTSYLTESQLRRFSNYPKDQTIRIKRSANPGPIITTTGVNFFRGFVFTLDQIPDYGEFTQLFDSFKIEYIRATFLPRTTDNNATGATISIMETVVDYDDGNNPTTLNELLSYDTVTYNQAVGDPFSIVFQPKVAIGAYTSSSLLTSYTTMADVWVDVASPATSHYGLKCAIALGNAPIYIDVIIDYHLAFKGVR